jgi:calsyntenin 1
MKLLIQANDKIHPTIGRRNIQIETTVSCPMKKAIRLPTIDTFIMINEVNGFSSSENSTKEFVLNTDEYQDISSEFKPQITISGSQNNLVSYHDIKSGVKFLENVNIEILTGGKLEEKLQKLDSCNVNGIMKNL